jgi:cytoskeleton protein RodZ
MNDNAYQETLFADPLGLQLKHAREKAGLKMTDVSAQLKLPVQVVDALEREDWNKLGAAVYVRSYLSSYLKFLGLPVQLASEVQLSNTQSHPAVKILTAQSARRSIDSTWMKFASLGLTVAIVALLIMLAMHFQKPRGDNQVMPLDVQNSELPRETVATSITEPTNTAVTAAAPNSIASTDAANASTPVMASMTPIASSTTNANTGWTLTMKGDSWIEIMGANGKRIDSGLISAGEQKQYALADVASMKIGNADTVELRRNGQVVDIATFNVDNVARFNVAADGTLSKK